MSTTMDELSINYLKTIACLRKTVLIIDLKTNLSYDGKIFSKYILCLENKNIF